MINNYRAVIFDMDGVLVDSEVHWHKVESEFLNQLIPSWGYVDQSRVLGLSVRDVHRLLTDEYELGMSFEQYLAHYQELAGEIYGEKSKLLNGSIELLGRLSEAKVLLGVASSSPRSWIEIVLGRFSLEHYFCAVVSADDLLGPSKPNPEIYKLAAKLLNVDPVCCIAIEDTDKGIASASDAGMFSIGLRNGFNLDQTFNRANSEANSYSELAEIIRELGIL